MSPRSDSRFLNPFRVGATALVAAALAACGGGGGDSSSSSTPPPSTGGTKYTIGGSVTGLTGTGLVLQDNGGDNLSVSASGAFTFATSLSAGTTYAVTVATQPSGQTCTITAGSGTANANVTNVAVTCSATTVSIGGTVTGLTGTGLVLQDNGGDNLAISASGNFTFATKISAGAAYSVTVSTQPTGQTCTVTNASGKASASVTNVAVACAAGSSKVTIGGSVSGLAGTGLVLQNNAGDNLAVAANGPFTFATAINTGAAYAVTVSTQPGTPAQRCTVDSGGAGNASANVTSVVINCRTTGQFLYTANNGDGTISGFTIDPNSGALTAMAGNPVNDGGAGTQPAAVSLAPNRKWAFSATNRGRTIYAFSINPATGVLTPTPHSPFNNTAFTLGHQFPDIAVDSTSKHLYLASQDDGVVAAFSIDQTTGDLTLLGGAVPAGAGAGAIPAFSPDGKYLYVMNQTDSAQGNSVSGYTIQADGSLVAIAGSPFATGGHIPTWISFRPDGKFAYVSNSNTGGINGSITVFSVSSTGALSAVGAPITVLADPADLTLDSSGTHLYVPDRGSSTVQVFSIDPTAGTLTHVNDATSGQGPQLVVIEPRGKYAYVSSSYGNDVYMFPIDPTTGALGTGTPYTTGPGTGKPLFINVDPSGQFAYTANNATNTVAGFKIDPTTGNLTPVSANPYPAGMQPFVVSISPELPGIRD